VIGALTFVLGDSERRFTPQDLHLITSLAARAALHIQNSRLYTERSHVAQVLQASLRPRDLPSIPGAEVAARFRAAGDQMEVGGDFYDIFRSEQSAWTAIIGDVVGKGPEAAASTALARHTLRTASMLSPDPAANLSLLNRRCTPTRPDVSTAPPATCGSARPSTGSSAAWPTPVIRRLYLFGRTAAS
jgi:sigma-B regulation protein RsbU (phosphoserine phosphatase)